MPNFHQVGNTDGLEPFPKKISFSYSRATSSFKKCHQAKEVLKHFESFKYWNVFEAKRISESSSIDFSISLFWNRLRSCNWNNEIISKIPCANSFLTHHLITNTIRSPSTTYIHILGDCNQLILLVCMRIPLAPL